MNKFKGLFLGIFLAAFFTACSSIVPPPVGAEITRFTWEPVTTMENGDPVSGPVFFRLYCDANAPVEAGTGITEYLIKDSLPVNAADGLHACNFTAHLNRPCVDTVDGVCESRHSNTLTIVKRGASFFAGEEPVIGIFRFK